MSDRIVISRIQNGFLIDTDWFSINRKSTVHFNNLLEVVEHLDTIYGGIERELKLIREKQVRTEDSEAVKAS